MKTTWIAASTLLFCTCLGLSACNRKLSPNKPDEGVLPDKGSDVVIAQNHFAFRLFREIGAQEPETKNSLVSPLSVFLNLSMAYNGAADSTKAAMQQTLGISDISTKVLNQTNHALIGAIPRADKDVEMSLANSIWYKNAGSRPLPKFLKTNTQYYQAQVAGTDFSPGTVATINRWVAQNTQDKIKSIIERIGAEDVMYLINAVYFKGAWKTPFDEKNTRERTFTPSRGSSVQVPFMYQNAQFNYLENDTVQMVELPYGNGDFSMYVILPGKEVSLAAFIAQLSETTLAGYVGRLDSVKITLRLPKWKYRFEISDLKPELTALGMGIAFTPDADFSNMYPAQTPTHISKVVHKSFIEVNEQGTEAAAATAIGVGVTSVPLHPPPAMEVNRPFVYVITEKKTGAVLFLGVVNNPAKE